MILPVDDSAIARAAEMIREGQPVAVPTETVYGLAADATSGEAVARIYATKGRPVFNPLIVHVANLAMAEGLASFSPIARRLAEAFWPGPLTLVLPAQPYTPIAALATAGLATIAIRMPAHPAMQALIAKADRPLAAPSANASGSISPTRPEHVAASLGSRAPLILDGGATQHGLESTIVTVDADRLRLLRPGPIFPDQLEELAGLPLSVTAGDKIEAPGQLASHYAPSKPLRLNATARQDGEWWIGFGAVEGDDNLSSRGDLIQAAANLFDSLWRADAADTPAIAVAPVPQYGLGEAINDRLARAAAPR
jgi:L-threonylcarbamoyladenylate synthase